ncbi:MAG: 4Fe-4S binding protein, partial [Spirochaetales bacterium]|nr:4Fe-4S binding protein [Spirochaetales bacterium]
MSRSGKRKTAGRIRTAVQVFFFIFIALISVNHTLEKAGREGIPLLSSASLHSLCPFGGVVSIYEYLDTGRMVRQVHESAFVLMWIGFALALILGPVFCGWVCPLG